MNDNRTGSETVTSAGGGATYALSVDRQPIATTMPTSGNKTGNTCGLAEFIISGSASGFDWE